MPATGPAGQTLSNSSADGKAAAHLCCDLISLIHLATKHEVAGTGQRLGDRRPGTPGPREPCCPQIPPLSQTGTRAVRDLWCKQWSHPQQEEPAAASDAALLVVVTPVSLM